MKHLALFLALASASVFADSFNFKCEGTDMVAVDSFSMEGLVDTSGRVIEYTVTTRKAGNNGKVETIENVVREAKFERLEDEVSGDFLGYRAYSVDQNAQHTLVNLLMNYPGQLDSRIYDASGTFFRSTCKAL